MAEKIVYNKLIRGKVPEIIEADGCIPKTRLLGIVAHLAAIRDKYPEEFQELDEAIVEGDDEHILLEIVDLQELLDAETILRGFTLAQRHRAQMQKRDERGGFEQGIYLESVVKPEADAQKTTLNTYDESAPALAEYFRGIGSRVEDIERAIELRGAGSDISALELGCGDGRDGAAIVERSAHYKGIDYSKGMIAAAQEEHSDIDFSVGDMLNDEFPQNQDIIFAFASMLHLDKDQLKTVLKKCIDSLAEGGILYISLKEKPEYSKEWKKDRYGERLFYFYNADLVAGLVDTNFTEVHRATQIIGETNWFTQAFQKKSVDVHTGKNWDEL